MIRLFVTLVSFLLFLYGPLNSFGQTYDSAGIQQLYERLYLLPEDQADSIKWYAPKIMEASTKLNYTRGKALAERLLGISAEYEEDTKEAIRHYLSCQQFAWQIRDTILAGSSISDEAGIYAKLHQYEQAKDRYRQYNALMQQAGEQKRYAKGLANLGVIYRKTGMYDSAMQLYQQGLNIRSALGDSAGMVTVRNSIASLLLFQNRPKEAIPIIRANLNYHAEKQLLEDSWFDYTNLCGAYTLLQDWPTAIRFGDTALTIAKSLKALNKEADTYEVLKELYQKQGNFRQAFEYQSIQMSLREQIMNNDNNASIAALREQFNARQREQENRLLTAEVKNQKLQSDFYVLLLLLALLALGAAAFAWFLTARSKKQIEKQNQLVQQQNRKLAALNSDKNALVSMVSHDLSGPFAQIGVWTQLLQQLPAVTQNEQSQQALEKIRKATAAGEQLIHNVLVVEKAEMASHELVMEEVRIRDWLDHLVEAWRIKAEAKRISVTVDGGAEITHLTDMHLLNRIFENLLSNAVKFTPAGGAISLHINRQKQQLAISCTNTGVGFSPAEIASLFQRYGKAIHPPSGDEKSHGLGLSIVKRLVDELGAEINVESDGSSFARFNVLIP